MAILEDPEQHEVTALSHLVPSLVGRRVLEIGCGDGRLTRRYAARAGSIIAIDPIVEKVAMLRAALPHVDARAIGLDDLDLPPHSIDVAIFSWSL